MPNRRGDGGRERHQKLDVAVVPRDAAAALHRQNTQRSCPAQNGNSSKDREFFFAELREMPVPEVLLGDRDRNRTHAFDDRTGDPLPHREPNLSERPVGKADVATHDQLVAPALQEVERGHVGPDDRRNPLGCLVEQRGERDRTDGERYEIENGVEPLVPAPVDARSQ